MPYKSGFVLLVVVFGWLSCTKEKSFPVKKCERISSGSVNIKEDLFSEPGSDSLSKSAVISQMGSLVTAYNAKDPAFETGKLMNLWEAEKNNRKINSSEMPVWVEATGLLLELTSDSQFAFELQKVADEQNTRTDSSAGKFYKPLVPFIFTKNTDHINVNLFANATLEYQHSMGGKVKITQEVVSASKILIRFSMEQNRYIELNILIPLQSKNPSVVEKKVKYVANPGEYCLVARKWGDGDVVEVNL